MAGSKWQRPGWRGADGDRNQDRQQQTHKQPHAAEVREEEAEAEPDTGEDEVITTNPRAQRSGTPAGPGRVVPGVPAVAGAPDPDAVTKVESAPEEPDEDPTTGWHYTDKEYPDEGACGPFASAAEAATHAAEAMPDGGFDLHAPRKQEATDGT
jgi:hypothetical protein